MTNSRVQEALKTLTEEGCVWKVWSIEDVRNRIAEMREDAGSTLENIPTGEDERIAERAYKTGWFTTLGDCTDDDWHLIDNAIYEALGV